MNFTIILLTSRLHLCHVMHNFLLQVCYITMTMGELDLNTVNLQPGQLWMKERKDMTLFIISSWSLELKNNTNREEGVRMRITFRRKIMNEIMTTYLPSILLIMITWATTFFKPYFFEAALSVNLTTMLVMTTIFIGVMQMLPSTAYVKMIDVWLIFGQLIPFTEVILLTTMEYFREGDGSGEELTEKEPTTIKTPIVTISKANLLNEGEGQQTDNNHDAITINSQTEVAQNQSEAWTVNDAKTDKQDPVAILRFIG